MKKSILVLIYILINICFFRIHTYGGNISSRYIFNTITIEDGLPLNFIDDIFKDTKGFIWISTQGGGLSRFDGYELLHFNVNTSPIELKSNYIVQTCEDRFNRLWIASDRGIDIISLSTIQKSEVICGGEQEDVFRNIISSSISSIYCDIKGNVWVVTSDKIYQICFDNKGNINHIYSLRSDVYNNKLYSFSTLGEIGDEMWVGYRDGVYKIRTDNYDNLVLQPLFDIQNNGFNSHISCFLKNENDVWIGTGYGVFRYNLTDKSQKRYGYEANNPLSLSQDMVTDIGLTDDNVVVVGTLRGLNFYDIKNDCFERVTHTKGVISLNSDFVNCILSDGNNLWVGTEAGGINKLTLQRLDIRNYIHDERDSHSLAPNPVNAILEDQFGDLWVGNVEGGLSRRRQGEDKFIHYGAGTGLLSHKSVSVLEEDKKNKTLWVGTWGLGINVIDLKKLPDFSVRQIQSGRDFDLNYVAHIKYDPINDGMWIGTNRNIYFYDMSSATLHAPIPLDLTKDIRGVLGMLIDDKDQLWIGTSSGIITLNLREFDQNKFMCRANLFDLGDSLENDLFQKNVTTIYQASDKTIWIGSKGYGFCKLIRDNEKYKCRIYTTNQGLANNSVFGILEDEQGLIWISTGNGISCYDPRIDQFVNYTKSDGLIDYQFYWNASYKSPTTKNLFFGGMNGLTELRSDYQRTGSKHGKVIFTKLQVLNKTVWASNGSFLKKDISYTDRIDIHERDKSFSIEFSALDYDNPSTIVYAYRLLEFDDKWIEVQSDRRFASYTNLKPGTYTLQVKSMSSLYGWSDDVAELTIVVHPFFYKTGWFIGICICLLLLLAVLFYKWRVSQFKKQREVLRLLVEERTKELEKQKELLEGHTVELKLQNEILITQNEKISQQRKELIDMSEKVQEAMSDKISFFTNITHEFRTPITLIVGPIDRALKLSSNPKVIEQLEFVSRNSRHLLSLINQLMDFRKVESDNITLSPTTGDFIKYLDGILLPFESFAHERNIEIKKLYHVHSPLFLFDEEAMHKVVTNLLSNAIKFTPDNGTIYFYIYSFIDENTTQEKLYISVRDTGSSIKESDLENVFDRFYQSKNNVNYPIYGQSGTGIGLYLCKKIVLLLGGTIKAKNNKTQGVSFRIILPLDREEHSKSLEILAATHTEIVEQEDDVFESEHSNSKMTILIVEDNIDMRKYIRSILQDHYKVLETENGEEALKILKKQTVDFIISDLMMPVMDGIELSKRVKADFSISHIPFLMLTAKTSVEAQIDSYKIGVDEFLQKPFDEELLLIRIKNIIDNRKLYQRKFSLYMSTEKLNIVEESQDEKFLKKALEIVKENYKNTDYEVSDFIEAIGMSKSLVNKKMQMLTGQSAGQFIRNYRLSLAHEMILKKYNSMNISEIAYEVGFNDPKYFTRCFTKHFGVAPSMLFKDDK